MDEIIRSVILKDPCTALGEREVNGPPACVLRGAEIALGDITAGCNLGGGQLREVPPQVRVNQSSSSSSALTY